VPKSGQPVEKPQEHCHRWSAGARDAQILIDCGVACRSKRRTHAQNGAWSQPLLVGQGFFNRLEGFRHSQISEQRDVALPLQRRRRSLPTFVPLHCSRGRRGRERASLHRLDEAAIAWLLPPSVEQPCGLSAVDRGRAGAPRAASPAQASEYARVDSRALSPISPVHPWATRRIS
jgi:hypothetical protein